MLIITAKGAGPGTQTRMLCLRMIYRKNYLRATLQLSKPDENITPGKDIALVERI